MPDDQRAVIEFLGDPATHGGRQVDRIDTHASIVFLSGSRAWKLKRAVRYEYLDFSTVERRGRLCAAEVAVNRRFAPALYRRAVPVVQGAEGLHLGGGGPVVDWVVEMNRFDQEDLLDRRAASGTLALASMPVLGRAIADQHREAPLVAEHDGADAMAWVVEGNAADLRRCGEAHIDPDRRESTVAAARAALSRASGRLTQRGAQGWIRRCHGDLHLGNIVLLDGRPTPFDAVEFNERITSIDVLYDLAFLLMDLWHRQLPAHASAVRNAYLGVTDDLDGLGLLPLFLSCRAAVRAKTQAAAAGLQRDPEILVQRWGEAIRYLDEARAFLAPPPARLVAIAGRSGTGKSTLAFALAPDLGAPPGAVVVRSDALRKRLHGVAPETVLGPEAYAPDVSAHVYADVVARIGRILRGAHSAIVDAACLRPEERLAIERAAADAAVPFIGVWLDAPEDAASARVAVRRGDISDATPFVVRAQHARDVGPVAWARLDAGRDAGLVLAEARRLLGVTPRVDGWSQA